MRLSVFTGNKNEAEIFFETLSLRAKEKKWALNLSPPFLRMKLFSRNYYMCSLIGVLTCFLLVSLSVIFHSLKEPAGVDESREGRGEKGLEFAGWAKFARPKKEVAKHSPKMRVDD